MIIIRKEIPQFIEDFKKFVNNAFNNKDIKLKTFLDFNKVSPISENDNLDHKTPSSSVLLYSKVKRDKVLANRERIEESHFYTFIGQLLKDYQYGEEFTKIYNIFQKNMGKKLIE
jgi:hypothetical protein